MNKISELSIFFPFWNEEKNIEHVVNDAISVAGTVAKKWEIVMVDDGSDDRTLEKARSLEAKHSNLRTIAIKPNRGYGAALRAGFQNARYNFVVFTDGDRQFDFSEISKFIEKIEHADIVIGYRKQRKDNTMRHVLMTLLKLWDYVFFRFYFRDIDCGFKMFKRSALDAIMPLRSDGAMITTEILAKAKVKDLTIEEVGVTHFPRRFGNQSGANLAVVTRAIFETLILWWDIRNRRF